MIPGQLIAPGQFTDPRVNFASVHGLMPVTVHMSFTLPRGNFERRVTRCTTPVTRLAEVTFLHVNRMQKLSRLPRDSKSSYEREVTLARGNHYPN